MPCRIVGHEACSHRIQCPADIEHSDGYDHTRLEDVSRVGYRGPVEHELEELSVMSIPNDAVDVSLVESRVCEVL